MRASKKVVLATLVFGASMGMSLADVLILKNGSAITGKFQGGDPAGVTFQVDGDYLRYRLADVHSITILPTEAEATAQTATPTAPPAVQATTPAPSVPPSYSTGRGGSATTVARTATPAQGSLGITVPAGTEITVRMIDMVDSGVHQTGEMFRASLDEPIIVGGRTIVSRGADVTTKLVSVEQAGRIRGRSELALVLFDMMIDGRKHEITTGEVYEAGSSRGTQTAQRVGGLAAVGAVIGAIVGGGSGAAKGAAAGAGAGTAIQVMTHGEKVQVPAESRLTFSLAKPLIL